MKKLFSLLERWAELRILILLFIPVLLFVLYVRSPQSPVQKLNEMSNSAGIPDEKAFITSPELVRLMDKLGSEGRWYYLRSVGVIDSFTPLLLNVFTVLGLVFFLKFLGMYRRFGKYFTLFPFLGMIFDYAENTLVRILFSSYPGPFHGIDRIFGSIVALKFAFYMSCTLALLLAALVSAVIYGYRKLRVMRES